MTRHGWPGTSPPTSGRASWPSPRRRGGGGSFGGGPAIPDLLPALRASLTAFKAALAPWDAGTAYLNFEENPADSRSFYDELTQWRLEHVKAAVDPRDVFRSNHPIT